MEPESAAREAQGNIADEEYEEGVLTPTLSEVRFHKGQYMPLHAQTMRITGPQFSHETFP